MADKRSLWNEAGKGGLILGGISIAYLLLTWLISKLTGDSIGMNFLVNMLGFVLWGLKLALCIIMMRRLILGFHSRNPESDSGRLFRYGFLIALYSALLYSAFYLVYVLYINPEAVTASFDAVREMYSGSLDSATMEEIENMRSSMPTTTFFFNFIWCVLFGTVLSAIFSKKAAPSDPFAE